MEKFKFKSNPKSYLEGSLFVAHLSGQTDTKEKLFSELKEKLKFPEYFGFNWDAVYDFLRDFYWINEKNIIIVVDELPPLDESSLKIYIEILIDATRDWKDGEEHFLQIVFPETAREIVQKYIK